MCVYKMCIRDRFCGTGAKVDGDKIEFSTPTHLTAGIYQKIDREGGVLVQ